MGRPARYIPENRDGVLVEITGRTIGARSLLVPTPNPRRFREIVVGVMGRALEVSPLEVCACVWTANHYHLLVVVQDQQQLSRFMHHLAGNVSKEIGRLRGWRGTLWERRYDSIVVSDEPEAQWARLKYVLAHGVKEGLCESPLDWPGVHAARQLVHGEPLEGFWFNRSKEWLARRRGFDVGRYDFATKYLVPLAPLPAFRDLTEDDYRSRIAELIGEIEAEGEQARGDDAVAGVERILSQDPFEPPTKKTKRSIRPLFHAASRQARDALRKDWCGFQLQFAEASEALRSGRRFEAAEWFPRGSYPPALPFVGEPPPRRPPAPPTRRFDESRSGGGGPDEVPVVEIEIGWDPVQMRGAGARGCNLVRSRGQPP